MSLELKLKIRAGDMDTRSHQSMDEIESNELDESKAREKMI